VLASAKIGEVAAGPVQVSHHHVGRRHGDDFRQRQPSAYRPRQRVRPGELDLSLVREDVFAKQIEAYLSGRSPYLRGTLGMVNDAG